MEIHYTTVRRVFFLIFLCAFIVSAPVSVFYALGYKFDFETKRFSKIGALSVASTPHGARIYINDRLMRDVSPAVIRELLPKVYTIRIEKEGYHTYTLPVSVQSSSVSKVSVVLIPKVDEQTKVMAPSVIYNYFVVKNMFSEKILAFTEQGMVILNQDLKIDKKFPSISLTRQEALSLEGVLETGKGYILWNRKTIWRFYDTQKEVPADNPLQSIYTSETVIRSLFLGLNDRYLIIWDQEAVRALDIEQPGALFPVYTLKSADAKVYYRTGSDILFVQDKLTNEKGFQLVKIDLTSKVKRDES